MDYYVLLGIPPNADTDTIRRAFRALARRYHPDAGEGSCTERFREIVIAYETLNDPRRRSDYDRVLRNKRVPGAAVHIVEPLMASAAPEPMLRARPRVAHAERLDISEDQARIRAIVDEVFRSWDELFLGAPRRRDQV